MFRFLLLASLVACSLGGAIFRRPRLDGRIVGGVTVNITDYPYQVSYEYGSRHVCGGSIISQEWVVTAAQCTDGSTPSSSRFRAGSSYRETGGTLHPAAQFAQHPQYDYWTLDFDISVVKVSIPFTYGSEVAPIALTRTEPVNGTSSTVSGWGTDTPGGSLATQLQAVEVEITPRAACNTIYAAYGGITDNMICAGVTGEDKDACQGDSGSPLVVSNQTVGIVSWGIGCASAKYPGVYTNVANLRSFITNQTKVN